MSEAVAKESKAEEDTYGPLFLAVIGGALGVAVGWLLWPVLGWGLLACGMYLCARSRGTKLIYLFWAGLSGAIGSYLMAQSGGYTEALAMYARLQWELVLMGLSYFTQGTRAPMGDILRTHLLQDPVMGVCIAFGPVLGILFSIGHTAPVASSAEASPSLYPKGEGQRKDSGREGIRPDNPVATWHTGQSFAEMEDEASVALWSYGVREGAVTGWIGVPKVGKSEAYTQLIGCMILGTASFLGFPVYPTSVVVMAEETPGVYREKALVAAGWVRRRPVGGPRIFRPFRRKLRGFWRLVTFYLHRLFRRPTRDVYVICGKQLPGAKTAETLPTYIDLARRKAFATGSRLIVFDSLNFWVREAITNDAAAKDAARLFGELAAEGFAVIVIHHMNKKGQMAGPDSLYSQLDFRVDCTVPGDEDPRTTDLRMLLWSGRFPRDYPAAYRQTMYHMAEGGYLRIVKAADLEPQEPEEDRESEPGEVAITREDVTSGSPELPGSIGVVWAWIAAQPAEWLTAEQIVAGVASGGTLKASGRIKSYVNELVATGKLAQEGEGKRGDPYRYRRLG